MSNLLSVGKTPNICKWTEYTKSTQRILCLPFPPVAQVPVKPNSNNCQNSNVTIAVSHSVIRTHMYKEHTVDKTTPSLAIFKTSHTLPPNSWVMKSSKIKYLPPTSQFIHITNTTLSSEHPQVAQTGSNTSPHAFLASHPNAAKSNCGILPLLAPTSLQPS